METDLLLILGSQVLVAAAVFGGIRADLRNMHNQIRNIDGDVTNAHNRIDGILLNKKS
jgi:hypothetical protein|tara:strand:- start:42 stop:215 length:174 start_codon:yes stop_codon:yes gene_type:complete